MMKKHTLYLIMIVTATVYSLAGLEIALNPTLPGWIVWVYAVSGIAVTFLIASVRVEPEKESGTTKEKVPG